MWCTINTTPSSSRVDSNLKIRTMRTTNTGTWYGHFLDFRTDKHTSTQAYHSHTGDQPTQGTFVYSPQIQVHISSRTTSHQTLQKRREQRREPRTASVSSILRIHFPACLRANNWLNNAVRNPPRCSGPVGEGANLSSGVLI